MRQPLKILFLAWNYPPAVGGIESVAFNLQKGLVDLGYDVVTIARYSGEGGSSSDVVRPASPGLLKYMWFALMESRRRLKASSVDLVVCSGIACAPIAFVVKLLRKIPYLVLAHGSDACRGGLFYKSTMRFLFRHARAIAANSKNTQQILERLSCVSGDMKVINPGVNELDFPEISNRERNALRLKHDLVGRKVLFSAGRLIRRKGILEFVQNVMPTLVRDSQDIVYLIAGGDATASLAHSERILDRLKALVHNMDLQDRVKVLGNVSDEELKELYYCADLFVLPAIPVRGDVEGFGIVFLEAALAGTPAVASRIGGIPEAVNDESGVLLDPEDWTGYQHVIADLFNNDSKLKSLGQQARKRVLENLTWRRISEQYGRFMTETVDKEK